MAATVRPAHRGAKPACAPVSGYLQELFRAGRKW